MHYTYQLLIMLLVNLSVVSAQMTQIFYRIQFNIDEYVLDQADKLVLDDVVRDYSKGDYGELLLSAHTDADASDTYNMTLSHKRAEAVTAYLSEKGLHRNRVSVKWFGERKPEKSNSNTEGKAINRRVDITLKQFMIANTSELIQVVSPAYKQTYTIKPTDDNTIKGAYGTTVSIPNHAFQTKSGKPITSGTIRIELQEFLSPKDAAFNLLSTISDGRMLESGGMFSIHAYAEIEEVALKKGKQMQVEMPTIHLQPGMELFTAVKKEDGVTEWVPASVPFIPKDNTPPIFSKLDTKYLHNLLIDLPTIVPDSPQSSYIVPAIPKAPKQPKSRPMLIVPTKKTIFTWYERLFVPWFILDWKLETERQRLEKIYASQLIRYNKRMARYETAHDQYVIDSTQYELTTLDSLRTWLQNRKEEYLHYISYIESKQWNGAVSQLIYLSDKELLTDQNPKGLFMFYLESRGQKYGLRKYLQAIYRIDFYLLKV
jgi:hypothetical protein